MEARVSRGVASGADQPMAAPAVGALTTPLDESLTERFNQTLASSFSFICLDYLRQGLRTLSNSTISRRLPYQVRSIFRLPDLQYEVPKREFQGLSGDVPPMEDPEIRPFRFTNKIDATHKNPKSNCDYDYDYHYDYQIYIANDSSNISTILRKISDKASTHSAARRREDFHPLWGVSWLLDEK
ncbi:hypothetical protein PoB_005641400 [Plakobranchus ocellatus]|uniref:Uncharacterized protein n=1 Tax=Plakobranchus ocellatus TaxID=259542 RepID=A0AAV4CGH7_9GAST|nr:hypothetical protein PoB_005641400 [Plakobranchus ocellatus]